jgi:hypothetical protein
MRQGEVNWPQVKDMLNERLSEDKEALKLQRQADDKRFQDLEKYLREMTEAGDREQALKLKGLEQLMQQHQRMQKEQIDYAFRAAKEAITEQKSTNNSLFEEQRRALELMRTALERLVSKDSFSVVESELRDGNATTLALVQDIATRQTAMESRGMGERGHGDELRSNTALVVSVIAAFAAVAGVLIVLLVGI